MKTTKITPRLTEIISESETSQTKLKQLPKPRPIDITKLEGFTE